MEANRKNSRVSFLRFVAALAMLLLGGSGGAIAQEKPAPKAQAPVAATKPAEPEAAKPPAAKSENSLGGPHEGIKVHGNWKIVVRNADGSVASRNEFENKLVIGGGDLFLATILARTATVGNWYVFLRDAVSPGGTPPCNLGSTHADCAIQEPNAVAIFAAESFVNLTVQRAGATQNTIVLSGSAKSTNGGRISLVNTALSSCPPTVAPSACGAVAPGPFTLTEQSFATPITVQAGQTIDVTVVLSFS